MNYNDIIFLDFETTGIDPNKCQPIQLAAVCIDGRKLEIRENSLFSSYICPIFDSQKCLEYGLSEMNDEITKKTGIDVETLKAAPTVDVVWKNQFLPYMLQWNPSKNKWKAPIKAGYNVIRYDDVIIKRLCGGHNRFAKNQIKMLQETKQLDLTKKRANIPEPYGFGNWDEDRNEDTLFAPRDIIDLMHIVWAWTENNDELKSLSFDSVREWLGISKEGAHNAVKDVMDGANVLIRFLKLTRMFAQKTKFKGAFE